jgi:hypothetical protein
MGSLEPGAEPAHELGIVIEAVAGTQELANTICAFARSTMLPHGYPGRISTAGNLAFPYSPSDFKAGEVYLSASTTCSASPTRARCSPSTSSTSPRHRKSPS